MSQALKFAVAFDNEFQNRTKSLMVCNEENLFRALHKSLSGLNPMFHVEEYHGGSRQVSFKVNASFARSEPLCELCDLMIITFSAKTKRARLTFLQAKYERKAKVLVKTKPKLSANLEQWYLLAKKPYVRGHGNFNPPSTLLSSAILPSIGTFGFFYKDLYGNFQMFYSVAEYLNPAWNYTQRHGRLIPDAIPCCDITHKIGCFTETISACGNTCFASNLYKMHIGTPVYSADEASRNKLPDCSIIRDWLLSQLAPYANTGGSEVPPGKLLHELTGVLNEEKHHVETRSVFTGAAKIIIIKSEECNEDI